MLRIYEPLELTKLLTNDSTNDKDDFTILTETTQKPRTHTNKNDMTLVIDVNRIGLGRLMTTRIT